MAHPWTCNDGLDAGSLSQEKKKSFLTYESHDVTKILAHSVDTDSPARKVYYEATLTDAPGQRHIFSVPDISYQGTRIPECLTCNQTARNCTFHEAYFSPRADYYILHCLGPGVPWTEIRSVDGNEIREYRTA